jgi:hypothetical protein
LISNSPWTGSSRCSGKPRAFTWKSAQDAASALNAAGGYANHADWRMPHIPELAMIVERQCANPRVNLTLFPDTPATCFWTATGRRGPGKEKGKPIGSASVQTGLGQSARTDCTMPGWCA